MNKYIFNIGLVLAVLLLLCLLSMPYGYYVLVRFVSMIIFGIMAWGFYNNNKISLWYLNNISSNIKKQ